MKKLFSVFKLICVFLALGLSSCAPSVEVVYQEVTVVVTATNGSEPQGNQTEILPSNTPEQIINTETIPPTDTPIIPTDTPISPTDTPIPQTPKILLISRQSSNSLYGFSKLQGLALENGIKVEGGGNMETFSGIIAYTGWGGWNASKSYLSAATLLDIDTFVRNGGRAVIFVTPVSSDGLKSTLGDLYFLTFASESIIRGESIVINGGDLFQIWEGLMIGSADNSYSPYISTYIAGDTSQGETTTIKSNETGEARTSSIVIRVGDGLLAFIVSPCTYGGGNSCRTEGDFFTDSQIDRLDNTEAAKSLLLWLTEQ